jgi:preprotein translocase subunit SecA
LTLSSIDELWMQHIDHMAHLREEVAFEWYAQKNPLVVYKERAYDRFMTMITSIEHRVIKWLLTAKPRESIDTVMLEENLLASYLETWKEEKSEWSQISPWIEKVLLKQSEARGEKKETIGNYQYKDTGRNDPCPCGSGKKFKQCHWI